MIIIINYLSVKSPPRPIIDCQETSDVLLYATDGGVLNLKN